VNLYIGAQHTVVSMVNAAQDHASDETPPYLVLELGFEQIANLHFKRDLPTPLELECAIETVEDQGCAHGLLLPPTLGWQAAMQTCTRLLLQRTGTAHSQP
jgi:hypothetical protein